MFEYTNLTTEDEILNHAQKLEGLTIQEIGPAYQVEKWLGNSSNKGAIGNAIQEVYFGIPANSSKLADFEHHSIELKVTPLKLIKNKSLSAKERLVLNIINYMEDYKSDFENSSLAKKSSSMLLIFYLYEEQKNTVEFKILKTIKFFIPEEDIETIKEDFNIIVGKIMAGEAHLLSESDTTYLAACTKGAGKGRDERSQPFSPIPAKQRAFSFKAGYITSYFNALQHKQTNKLDMPTHLSLNEFITQTLQPYINLSTSELETRLNFYPVLKRDSDKGYLSRLGNTLINRIFNTGNVDLENTEQFKKAQLKVKTIRLRTDGKNNDMSWPNLNFHDIYSVPFEDSTWYEWFVETKYLLLYFKDAEHESTLHSHKIWNAPEEMIAELEGLYNHIKKMLIEDTLKYTINVSESGKETYTNNLPSKKDLDFFQIRPKGTKEYSFTTLPNGQKFKKQCLFVNKEYFHELIGYKQPKNPRAK